MGRQHTDKEWENIINDYYNTYHTIDIPTTCVYKGYNVGRWITTQKVAYKENRLNEEKKIWLDNMEMIWDNRLTKKNNDSWDKYYQLLKSYYSMFHNVNVPLRYEQDGMKLGKWLQRQRENGRNGKLEDRQISLLNELGLSFDRQNNNNSSSTSFPEQVVLYYTKKMFPRVLNRYTGFGFELDIYVRKYKFAIEYDGWMYHKERLSQDEQKNLFCMDKSIDLYRIREYGCPTITNCNVYTYNQTSVNGYDNLTICLRELFKDIAKKYHKEMIDIDVCRDMVDIMKGINTNISKEWLHMYQLYKECVDKLGTPDIPVKYTYKGYNIGVWCSTQRQVYLGKKAGFLTSEQQDMLNELGFCWNIKTKKWNEQYEKVKSFIKENGTLPSGKSHTYSYEKGLYHWVKWQRKRLNGVKVHPMDKREFALLSELGIV